MKSRFISNILPSSQTRGLVLLTGARQTGKTTLTKKYYADLRYINFDSLEQREKTAQVHTEEWSKIIGPSVIDEAQKWPMIFEKIKYNYDNHQLNFSVLLGSAQILLLKNTKESLAGRVRLYELYPLMLCELITSSGDAVLAPLLSKVLNTPSISLLLQQVPNIDFERDYLIKNWENYLMQFGGMPNLLSLSEERDRFDWIRDYEQTYLERDLSDLARLHDLQPFRLFQKLSALRSAQLINFSELARDASLSVDTAKRYIEYLKLSYQVFLLQPYYRNLTSSLVKTPKLYWTDLGIWRSLSNVQAPLSGQLYETYVVSECMKWIKSAKERSSLYFYRTRHGLEIDLIIETPHGMIAAEIKGKQKVDRHDISGLLAIQQSAPNCIGGIVIYLGDEIKEMSKDIWAIPSWRLFS